VTSDALQQQGKAILSLASIATTLLEQLAHETGFALIKTRSMRNALIPDTIGARGAPSGMGTATIESLLR
jgi:hypothetical protein